MSDSFVPFGASAASSSQPFIVPSSSPLSSALPDVLADRATGGGLTIAEGLVFIERETGTRLHRATLWRWILSKRLPSYRVGGKVRTTKNAIRALLEADAKRGPRSKQRDEVERAGAEAAARIAGLGSA